MITDAFDSKTEEIIKVWRNENAKKAIDALQLLKGLEAHSTVILSQVDMGVFKKLGINITCEPKYQRKSFYHR